MIKPNFLAVLVLGKDPEGLILLDFITTDNTLLSHILTRSADVEDLVFGPFYKFLPFFLDPFHFWLVRGFDILNPSHYDGLLFFSPVQK